MRKFATYQNHKTLRYFFHIAYHGQAYHGWQKNDTIESVQIVIEQKLTQVLKRNIFIVGCGRTDAQVNASQYYFHLDVKEPLASDLLFKVNKALPADIAVFDILLMDDAAHARFDALSRRYEYHIVLNKNVFENDFAALLQEEVFNENPSKSPLFQLKPERGINKVVCFSPQHNLTIPEMEVINELAKKKNKVIRCRRPIRRKNKCF